MVRELVRSLYTTMPTFSKSKEYTDDADSIRSSDSDVEPRHRAGSKCVCLPPKRSYGWIWECLSPRVTRVGVGALGSTQWLNSYLRESEPREPNDAAVCERPQGLEKEMSMLREQRSFDEICPAT